MWNNIEMRSRRFPFVAIFIARRFDRMLTTIRNFSFTGDRCSMSYIIISEWLHQNQRTPTSKRITATVGKKKKKKKRYSKRIKPKRETKT
jgi:hypothetical protein